MGSKDWTLELGERTVNPADADEVLKDKVSERKRKQLERQEEIDEAAHKAKLAELQKKTVTSEVSVDKAGREQPPASPFVVKGEVNMGTIDFQAQQREAQAELKRLRDEGDKQNQTLGQINQQLRDEIHKKEMAIVEIGLRAEIQKGNEKLEQLIQQGGTKKNFLEEYSEQIATAKSLGLYNPQAGTNASEMIEIKKMEFNQTLELRRLAREEKRDDRALLFEMKKWDDEKEFRKEEVVRAKKRDEMWASAPETIGRFIARGMVEGGMGGDSVGESPVGEEAPPIPKGKQPGLAAGVGEAGVMKCPQCQEPTLAVGPTARVAVCGNCGAKYPIKRVKQEVASPVEEE